MKAHRMIMFIALLILYRTSTAAEGDTIWVAAHDKVDMTWFGNYDEWAVFPDDSKTYRKIILYYTLGCASGGCSDWDYTTQIQLMHPTGVLDSSVASIDTISTSPLEIDTTWETFEVKEAMEMGRVITPYGGYMADGVAGFDNSWEHTYAFEVTDFTPLLKDSVLIRAHYSGWSSGFSVTLDFAFIEGPPVREVLSIENLWSGSYNYSTSADFESGFLTQKTAMVPAEAKGAKLRFTPTGHGFDNSNNCAEFCPRDYYVFIDGSQIAQRAIWSEDCGLNPIFPQGGTWLYDRANWCPGGKGHLHEIQLTPYISPGTDLDVDVDIEEYTWSGTQTPSYIIDGQLVTYRNIAQEHDVELLDIIRPSTKADYSRQNPICSHPVIRVRNNGSEILQTFMITYGVEGGQPCYYTWQGNLAFNEETEVVLPNINWSGFNTASPYFYAKLSDPNNQNDAYPGDNEQRSSFETVPLYEDEFVIWLRTNNAGSESSYTLEDDLGNIIHERSGLSANMFYKDTISLAPGCYTLKLLDSGKDGLSWWANDDGAGYLRLRSLEGTFFKVFEPDFGTSIYHEFTVGDVQGAVNSQESCDVSAVEEYPLPQKALSVYPNPTKGSFQVFLPNDQAANILLQVHNTRGKRLYSNNLPGGKGQSLLIDLSEYPSGIYIVSALAGQDLISKKIIKQ